MAKTKPGISKKARKSIVLRIMNILFFLALIVGITIAVLMFTPVAHDVKLFVKSWGWSEGFTASLNKWVRWHVVPNFQLPLRWNHHSVTFTSCLYIFLMCSGALIGYYLMYIPFLIMYRLKLKGKTQVWRKFVFWFAILITFCLFASIKLNFWRQRIARDLDWAYPVTHFVSDVARWWRSLFLPNGMLRSLVITEISGNATAWSLVYVVIINILIDDILFILASVGPAKKVVPAAVKDDLDEVEEEKEVEKPVDDLIPAPVMVNGVVPTVRELAVVNSLNPLYDTRIETLPGLYEEKVETAEPVAEAALAEDNANKVAVELAKPVQKKIVVLPGIDEWNADPWDEDEQVLADEKPVEEPVEEVVEEVKEEVVEEPKGEVITEEVASEPVEEVIAEETPAEEVKEEEVDNTASPDKDLTEAAAPEQEDIPVEEPVEEIKEEVVEEPVEEVKEEVAESHEEPVVEEKPVEPAKPAPRVAQVNMVAFDPSKRERKNVAPVGVVEPIKKEEEPAPVVEEEKPNLAPIAGPLHSTEKSKHDKIEVVEARKVRFELKNYLVKTYEGDLTPEEAFAKGVTKVQPVVNPIFANKTVDEPAWKQKKRKEDIRVNGYVDVEHLETLNGKKGTTSAVSKKATSIRDLVKAKKAASEKANAEETNEENKISKPITPVSFKPVEKPVEPKTEEVKQDKPAAPAFHPIAPIQKRDRKHPDIKLVDPMKSKNNN